MKNDDKILESLIAGGVVGAALGALLSKDKEPGAILGALAGAALLATFKANQQAIQTNVPMYIEENGSLYQVTAGTKKFIRKIEKPTTKIEQRFKLK
jgi:Glycine zipper 2TM domain